MAEQREIQEAPGGVEQFFFGGSWLPDMDASEIGPDNYTIMQNLKYSDDSPVGVNGYTKRTSTTAPFIV